MASTGEMILWQQEDMLKVLLPRLVYTRDWARAKLYFLSKIERVRRERLRYEAKVEELERRVSLLMAKVVALENA